VVFCAQLHRDFKKVVRNRFVRPLHPGRWLEMSESIKTYLVIVFCNQSFKNSTKGQSKPNIPSEQPGGTLELTSS
jgi:hypothetical protein